MNPFSMDMDAAQYDERRPYFHPMVFDRLVRLFGGGFETALDVACGTGQSTEALAAVSTFVIGLDVSEPMLKHARCRGAIPYIRGRAEQLPFQDAVFDIVTVGLGFHWFDRGTFLSEASRVLHNGAWLLIYDSGFAGRMRENPAFSEWVAGYRERFPAPTPDDRPTPREVLERLGFTAMASDRFTHSQVYDVEQLVHYLETQSNIRVAVQQKRQTLEQISTWLKATLRPLFPTERATFEYEGWSLLLQKAH